MLVVLRLFGEFELEREGEGLGGFGGDFGDGGSIAERSRFEPRAGDDTETDADTGPEAEVETETAAEAETRAAALDGAGEQERPRLLIALLFELELALVFQAKQPCRFSSPFCRCHSLRRCCSDYCYSLAS